MFQWTAAQCLLFGVEFFYWTTLNTARVYRLAQEVSLRKITVFTGGRWVFAMHVFTDGPGVCAIQIFTGGPRVFAIHTFTGGHVVCAILICLLTVLGSV